MNKLIKVVVVVAVCFGIVGCGGGKKDKEPKKETQETKSKKDKATISSEDDFFDEYEEISDIVLLKNADFKAYLSNGGVVPYDMGGLKFLMAYTDDSDSLKVQYIVNDDISYILSLNTKTNALYEVEVNTHNGVENEKAIAFAMICILDDYESYTDDIISEVGGALIDLQQDICTYGDNFIISTSKNDDSARYSIIIRDKKPS